MHYFVDFKGIPIVSFNGVLTSPVLSDGELTPMRFLMSTKGLTEDEAISLMSVAVDFGVTQVVDGNWGVHAVIKKSLFAGAVA